MFYLKIGFVSQETNHWPLSADSAGHYDGQLIHWSFTSAEGETKIAQQPCK